MHNIKKTIHIAILILVSYIIVKNVLPIETVTHLKSIRLFSFSFIVLPIGCGVPGLLKGIYKDYIEKLGKDQRLEILLETAIADISSNIKKMVYSIFAIILIFVSENSTIILIKFNSQESLDIFNGTYKTAVLLYLILATFDIIIPSLKLYESELRHKG